MGPNNEGKIIHSIYFGVMDSYLTLRVATSEAVPSFLYWVGAGLCPVLLI